MYKQWVAQDDYGLLAYGANNWVNLTRIVTGLRILVSRGLSGTQQNKTVASLDNFSGIKFPLWKRGTFLPALRIGIGSIQKYCPPQMKFDDYAISIMTHTVKS
jgi:hypothetical protein